ncbi:hypothetical protein M2323_004282 [Rhodoblastus acidophilus]|uniref:hypothetical protein n=1 Tax=Rhodoblastus acidophilus TaxID=1074 RepID=UPI0022259494|nr:hypothetical protein [Rhodoblastus acidophilus]MCW2286477.1 hypothetical protein [Rhodoblastus acidophilus]MCW2335335.1 hypothetical protein [Rhodoblastus acidophilus]
MDSIFPILIFVFAGLWPALGMVKGLDYVERMGRPVDTPDLWLVTWVITAILLYCAVHSALDPHFLTKGQPERESDAAIPRAVKALLFFWAAQPLPALWLIIRSKRRN